MSSSFDFIEILDFTKFPVKDGLLDILLGPDPFQSIFEGNIGRIKTQVSIMTLFGHKIEGILSFQYTIKDRKAFIASGAYDNTSSLGAMVVDYLHATLNPIILDDYFYIYKYIESPFVAFYKAIRDTKSKIVAVEPAALNIDIAPAADQMAADNLLCGCFVKLGTFDALEKKDWIYQEAYMTADEVQKVWDNFDSAKLYELAYLSLEEIKQRSMKQQTFRSHAGKTIKAELLGNNLKIFWKDPQQSLKGKTKIYREEGGFSPVLESGVMIADSAYYNGEAWDYKLTPDKPYYYTVIDSWEQRDSDGRQEHKTNELCRFSVIADTTTSKTDEQIEEYKEQKRLEAGKKKIDNHFMVDDDMNALKVDVEKRKRLLKARDQFANDLLDGKQPDEFNEVEQRTYEEFLELIDFQIKQFTMRR